MSDLGSQTALKAGDAKGLRIAVVVASFNSIYTRRLLNSANARLKGLGAKAPEVAWVPGALELPLAVQAFAKTGAYDAVIAIGCVIRGETTHYDLVSEGAAQGILQAGLSTGIPAIFGVITCENKAQVLARCSGGSMDAGLHAANAAVSMALLLRGLQKKKRKQR